MNLSKCFVVTDEINGFQCDILDSSVHIMTQDGSMQE